MMLSLKNGTVKVHHVLRRWVYGVDIPFHTISHDSLINLRGLRQFGPIIKHQVNMLREPLLKREVERTKEALKKQQDSRENWLFYSD